MTSSSSGGPMDFDIRERDFSARSKYLFLKERNASINTQSMVMTTHKIVVIERAVFVDETKPVESERRSAQIQMVTRLRRVMLFIRFKISTA